MKIHIYHANAGYGHRKVAEVIAKEMIERSGDKHQVACHDALEFAPRFFQKAYPSFYYDCVKHAPGLWGFFYESLDLPWLYPVIYPFRVLYNTIMGSRLLRHVQQENPDVIICTHFFSAELLSRAKQQGKISATILTVITDFYPHRVWTHPGTDHYWMMSEEGKEALLERGIAENKISALGIPVDSVFLSTPPNTSPTTLGLEENRLTVLLTSGSFGLGTPRELLQIMNTYAAKLQCLVVCGKNEEAKRALEELKPEYPVKIFGFVDNMHQLMACADLMIAKPGGATTTESLVMGLPMVILNPIPGQESRNANLLTAKGIALIIKQPAELKPILERIFNSSQLDDLKQGIQSFAKPNATRDLVKWVLSKGEH